MISSHVYFTKMQNEVDTGGKRQKTLRSFRSATPFINYLKRYILGGISLEDKIIKKNRNACTTETKLRKHNNN